MIHMLEILKNFSEIQDLNYAQFICCCENFVAQYSDMVFEQVYQQKRYQKKNISFMGIILDHYGVQNNLSKYLSGLSEYKHPTMEGIYKAACLS